MSPVDLDLLVQPGDGFQLNDARPNSATRSGGPDWPLPQTLAGMLRTAWGRQTLSGAAWHDSDGWLALAPTVTLAAAVTVARPLGDAAVWGPAHRCWPVPADCLALRDRHHTDQLGLWRLDPRPLPDGAGLLPLRDHTGKALDLWFPPPPRRDKPVAMPPLWSERTFIDWLARPLTAGTPRNQTPEEPRLALQTTGRTRVALQAATGTADEGLLFGERHTEPLLAAVTRAGGEPDRTTTTWLHWALALRARLPGTLATPVRATLGGGRLSVRLEAAAGSALFDCPAALREALAPALPGLRLVTIAPLWCGEGRGWLLPGFAADNQGHLVGEIMGVGCRLVAQISGRAHAFAGWDMARGQHKRTRRCLPAGSVLYILPLSTDGLFPPGFGQRLWLSQLGEGREDGLGTIVAGPWRPNREPAPLATPSSDQR